jgi:NAD(P)-dependent dehydrogenase (short-subunit alcohol dehydrogenase family)
VIGGAIMLQGRREGIATFSRFLAVSKAANMARPLVTITGASHGIGRALARAFASEGHALLLIARHAEEIEGLGAVPHRWAEVDVTDYARLKGAVDDAEETFGPTDCLINNAGFLQLGIFVIARPRTSTMTSTCFLRVSFMAFARYCPA